MAQTSDQNGGDSEEASRGLEGQLDTDKTRYQLLAAIDGTNRAAADLYTDWAWHQTGSARGIDSMHSDLNAIESRVEKARSALEQIEEEFDDGE